MKRQSYLARIERGINGASYLVNVVTGTSILPNLPLDIPIEVEFKWEAPKVKRSATFTVDAQGNIKTSDALIMMQPGSKITVEWEEEEKA